MNDQRSVRIWAGIALAILAVLALGGFLWSQGYATPSDPGTGSDPSATPTASASAPASSAAASSPAASGESADPGPGDGENDSPPPTSPAPAGSAQAATLEYFKALNAGDRDKALSFFADPDGVAQSIVTSALGGRPYTKLAVSAEPTSGTDVVTVTVRGISGGTPFAETYDVANTDQGWKAVVG